MATPLFFEEWIRMLEQVFAFQFDNKEDIILWKWNPKKMFTTRSVYDHLSSEGSTNSYNHIWKSKLRYKIKIFTWLLEREAVLTKDNMIKRNLQGDPSCIFCSQLDTIDHLFFQCPISKCVWALIGHCFGTNSTPRNSSQYK